MRNIKKLRVCWFSAHTIGSPSSIQPGQCCPRRRAPAGGGRLRAAGACGRRALAGAGRHAGCQPLLASNHTQHVFLAKTYVFSNEKLIWSMIYGQFFTADPILPSKQVEVALPEPNFFFDFFFQKDAEYYSEWFGPILGFFAQGKWSKTANLRFYKNLEKS